MRVYLAMNAPALREALSSGQVALGPVHAVTGELRSRELAVDPRVDDEELELIAMLDAARSSLALLAAAPGSPERRLVVAADVPGSVVVSSPVLLSSTDDEQAAASAVVLHPGATVRLAAVACAFVDEAAAEPAVRSALSALALVRPDDEVSAALDAVDEHDLLWYDATELAALAAELDY